MASWTAVTPVSYTVTFDSNGGSSVPSQTVVSGQTATEPTAPTKTDYTFAGWTLNNAAFSFSTPITGDITLVASWTAVTPTTDDVLTDLTNTNWLFNNQITFTDLPTNLFNEFDVNFTSNDINYTFISVKGNARMSYYNGQDSLIVYDDDQWYDSNYQELVIIDGQDTTNTTLINWLSNNATLLQNTTNSEDPTTDPINPIDPFPDPEDDPDDPEPVYFTVTYYDYDEQATISSQPGQRVIFDTEQVLEGDVAQNYNNYPSSAYFIFQYWAYIDSGEEFDPFSLIYEDVF